MNITQTNIGMNPKITLKISLSIKKERFFSVCKFGANE